MDEKILKEKNEELRILSEALRDAMDTYNELQGDIQMTLNRYDALSLAKAARAVEEASEAMLNKSLELYELHEKALQEASEEQS